MLKAAGAVLTLSAGLCWGFHKRRELSRRLERLLLLRWEVGSLRSKICGLGMGLQDAFSGSAFFSPAAEALSRGVPVCAAVGPLGEGIEGFSLFAEGLASDTTEGQLQNIDIFLSGLEEDIHAAREDLYRRGRLYLGGGFLAGAALVIFLL